MRVDFPVEGVSIVGMEEHEDFRKVAIAIEDEVGGVFSDIDKPIEILEENIG